MGIFDFLGIKKSVDSLIGQVNGIKRELEGLRREREELQVMPAAKADVIEQLCLRIDAVAAEYPADLTRAVGGFLASSKTHRLSAPTFSLGVLLPQASGAGAGMSAATLMHGMAFLFRDPLKKAIAEAINAAEWPETTVTLATRTKRLEELDDRIGKLEAEEDELRNHAARAGIVLP